MAKKLEEVNTKTDSEQQAQDLKKFQLAVENASDHIVITDPNGIILYANKAVEKITGFRLDEIMNQKVGSRDNWGGNMDPKIYKKLWNTIKVKKQSYFGEILNKRKNGEKYIAEAKITPVIDKNGEVVFFVGIERDITKAKEVDRMKTEFISLASHQLRTPLSAMKWFLEMLLDGDAGKLNQEQKEFVTKINQSNERMIDLVNSLLNISRIESGRIIIDPQPTDLQSLVSEVIAELQNKIANKHHHIVISAHEKLPKINIDPKLIHHVYMNLLTNAIKYTPLNGEITIVISKNNKEIISQISDSGYGIPKDEQGKVFSRFFRARNIIKVETDGTGLGLYLVKAIVESSGGKIWFKSEEEKGTSCWFSLPLTGSKTQKGGVTIDS